jgi:MFS superfamily sulfate permease-like transporter
MPWQRGRNFIFPPALLVVILGSVLAALVESLLPTGALNRGSGHYLELPLSGIFEALARPDFSALWSSPNLLLVSITLALVASIETLLSIEATDKIDPFRRVSPPNRELLAQGTFSVVFLQVVDFVLRSPTRVVRAILCRWS